MTAAAPHSAIAASAAGLSSSSADPDSVTEGHAGVDKSSPPLVDPAQGDGLHGLQLVSRARLVEAAKAIQRVALAGACRVQTLQAFQGAVALVRARGQHSAEHVASQALHGQAAEVLEAPRQMRRDVPPALHEVLALPQAVEVARLRVHDAQRPDAPASAKRQRRPHVEARVGGPHHQCIVPAVWYHQDVTHDDWQLPCRFQAADARLIHELRVDAMASLEERSTARRQRNETHRHVVVPLDLERPLAHVVLRDR
eukprot:CAMPEP_0171199218 /NCGR_PEP_ID=MMETSP0790-20130122/23351_1 /TAXON_ID=2925 /ORGANISM="Alexandrium catenella, Strain OF101" /LENGTH=254 /DNA_ID=CAMNT_0011664559 /DNA_START=141 /DNA_END=904 /DNA_ORIENTATION=-